MGDDRVNSIYLNKVKKVLSFVISLIMILSLVFSTQFNFSMVFAATPIDQNVTIALDSTGFYEPMTLAPELTNGLSFSDPIDGTDNGKKIITLGAPSMEGNTFKYLISPDTNAVPTPAVNFDASSWTAVANGDKITVDDGKHIGVAEVDNDGKVVRFSDAVAVVVNETADLSNLTLSDGALAPTFASSVYNYTSTVSNNVDKITLTPTAQDVNAIITVNGTVVASGSASQQLSLNVGDNSIPIVITASDGETIMIYNVKVARASSPYLTGLAVTYTALNPTFNTNSYSYSCNISNTVSSVRVRPIAEEPSATIYVNGLQVSSGVFSQQINMVSGSNDIIIKVISAIGQTEQIYNIVITKP
jgi:hypothetical protein